MNIIEIVFIIVIGTVIWVGYDAKQNRVPIDGKPYSLNNGAVAWVLTCILLWIFFFPYYLVKRGKFIRQNSPGAVPAASTQPQLPDFDEQLRRLAKLKEDGIITAEDFDKKKKALLEI